MPNTIITLDETLSGQVDQFLHLFKRLVKAIERRSQFTGGQIMFIVKDDNPDVAYSITAPSVTDAEGNPIPDASLTYEVTSSDDTVVAITPADPPTTGSVHFGNPGQAAINVNVKSGDALLGAFGAQFTVTVGDPAAITGGSISFEGLTDQ